MPSGMGSMAKSWSSIRPRVGCGNCPEALCALAAHRHHRPLQSPRAMDSSRPRISGTNEDMPILITSLPARTWSRSVRNPSDVRKPIRMQGVSSCDIGGAVLIRILFRTACGIYGEIGRYRGSQKRIAGMGWPEECPNLHGRGGFLVAPRIANAAAHHGSDPVYQR